MGVIPGLVSIPVVKSFCVLFVYYGFLWEFHFAASSLYYIYHRTLNLYNHHLFNKFRILSPEDFSYNVISFLNFLL